MTTLEPMVDIAIRLRELRRPDRAMDWEIHHSYGSGLGAYGQHPQYTLSVDAALTLCEPRLSWHVWSTMEGGYAADVYLKLKDSSPYEHPPALAKFPAIALCIAAIKARAAHTSPVETP